MELFGIFIMDADHSRKQQMKLIDVVKAQNKNAALLESTADAKGLNTYVISANEYKERADKAISIEQKEALLGYAREIENWTIKKKKK